jgi:hypothetical protein
MNIYFKQLIEWIKQHENIEEQELIQALFLLRAHYSLAGIVVICQRIFTLIGDDELPEFRDELNTLKIISRLQILINIHIFSQKQQIETNINSRHYVHTLETVEFVICY